MTVTFDLPKNITNLVTDSRRITSGNINDGNSAFVAIRTGVGDGHRFIRHLYDKGLRHFVVEDASSFSDLEDAVFTIAKNGALNFLIEKAGNLLRTKKPRQIVITGSHRKTTTKELLTKVLKAQGKKVARSPRTWNSAMGVALSIFDNLSRNTEIIITEVGIDAPGQAKRLSPMLCPEIGIITDIDEEHDEAFVNHAAKVAEKIEIVRHADKIYYVDTDPEVCVQIEKLNHPNALPASCIEEIVEAIGGCECPPVNFSTAVEVRQIPDNGVMVIDSFINDLESLPLSLSLAIQRQTDKKLAVFLGDFDGDKDRAREIIEDRDGRVFFFDSYDKDYVKTLHRNDFAGHLVLIKSGFPELITFFDEARHDTTLQVDLDALVHNFNVYRRLLPQGTGIVAMVKADAYGLGAIEVAKTLQAHGARYLAVAVVDEGVALRKAGVTMPIIVLNPITNRFEHLVAYNLEPTVFSLEELERIEEGIKGLSERPVPVHIKLDTGMHRVGFAENEIPEAIKRLKDSRLLTVSSIFSHLATADCPELLDYAENQIILFNKISHRIKNTLGKNIKCHILNTAGIEVFGKEHPEFDLGRLGIGLYGISPAKGKSLGLRSPARLVSTIIALKSREKGTTIGYGCKGVLNRDSVIATIPVGYADGIDRRLGNGNAAFMVQGFRSPTVGNICMDLLMIDVTDAVTAGRPVKIGSEVEIFGPQICVEELADKLGTIPYEILTSVSPRVRRTYHQR